MSATYEATFVQVIQILIALISAYVLLRVLKGSALIRRKGVQLGGSAAIFVIILFVLNRYLPDIQQRILSEQAAAQPVLISKPNEAASTVKVSISPATQLVTKRDLESLDKNQFEVNTDLNIAVLRQSSIDWETNVFDSVNTISSRDVPVFAISHQIFEPFFGSAKPTIFGVRRRSGTP